MNIPSFLERETEAQGKVGKWPPASGLVRDRGGVGFLCHSDYDFFRLVLLLGLNLVASGNIVQMTGVPQF